MKIEALAYSPRDNSDVALTVQLHVLPDVYNVCDPIKLILIMALRTGNVAETSITTLLETTRRRKNRTIAWVDAKRPIVCSADAGHALYTDRPAPESQLRRFLQRSSELVGMLNRPGCHDIRRGAAFEMNEIDATSNIGGVDRAADLLGHSGKVKAAGLTKKYIGGAVDARFEERLTVALTKTAVKAPVLAGAPYTKPVFGKAEVDKWIHANAWSDNSRAGRVKVRRALVEKHRKEWEEDNNAFGFADIEALDFAPPQPTEKMDTAIMATAAQTFTAEPDTSKSKNKRKREIAQSPSPEAEVPLDPRLELLTHRLQAGLTVDDLEEFDDLFDVEVQGRENLVEQPEQITGESKESRASISVPQDPLQQPLLQFVDFFSRINISNNTLASTNVKDSELNSRSPRTPFLHVCSKGCGRTDTYPSQLRVHEAKCSGVARFVKKEAIYKCPDCDKMFKSTKTRDQHVRDHHKWKPKPCSTKGCHPSVLYQDCRAYKAHRLAAHKSYKPRTCPDCLGTAAEKVWATLEAIRTHYLGMHRKTQEQFVAMMAAGTKEDEHGEE
jgi:hypothetical protein